MALTFDARANADGVASVLATLQRYSVPATFFLTGTFVRDFPVAARSIAAAGERIGDHTVSHPYLTGLSDAAVRQQILDAAQQIVAATGKRPGEIVLMHVGSNPDDHTTFDADALPQVITELRGQGYSFVMLDALTG